MMYLLRHRISFITDSGYGESSTREGTDVELKQIASYISKYIEQIPDTRTTVVLREIIHYVTNGDFESKSDDQIVCVNPTLLTLDKKLWQVIILIKNM